MYTFLGTERHLRQCEGHVWMVITRRMKSKSIEHDGCYAVAQHPIKCYHVNDTGIFQRSANDTDRGDSSDTISVGKCQYIKGWCGSSFCLILITY